MVAEERMVLARKDRPETVRPAADFSLEPAGGILHLFERGSGHHHHSRLDVVRKGILKAVEVRPPGRFLADQFLEVRTHLEPVDRYPAEAGGGENQQRERQPGVTGNPGDPPGQAFYHPAFDHWAASNSSKKSSNSSMGGLPSKMRNLRRCV